MFFNYLNLVSRFLKYLFSISLNWPFQITQKVLKYYNVDFFVIFDVYIKKN